MSVLKKTPQTLATAAGARKAACALKRAFEHLGLDPQKPGDWGWMRAIVLDGGYLDNPRGRRRRGRPKGKGNRYRWDEDTLAWLGGAVESHKETYSKMFKMGLVRFTDGTRPRATLSDAQLAKSFARYYQCDADTLRKMFPEARKAIERSRDHFEKTYVHYEPKK